VREAADKQRREGAGRRLKSFPPIVDAGRAKRRISVTAEAKFSGLQGLENSKNGERISTFSRVQGLRMTGHHEASTTTTRRPSPHSIRRPDGGGFSVE